MERGLKNSAPSMQIPETRHMSDLKRAAWYLVKRPEVAMSFKQQKLNKTFKEALDSDHAADKTTRKPSTGIVIRMGRTVTR